jgi:hypothetical protein
MGFLRLHRVGTGHSYAGLEEGRTASFVLLALLVLNLVGMIAIIAISAVR